MSKPAGAFGETPAGGKAHVLHAEKVSADPKLLWTGTINSTSGEKLAIDGKGWGEHALAGTNFQLFQYGSDFYLQVAEGSWQGYYLSYNNNNYIGAYKNWSDARYVLNPKIFNNTFGFASYPGTNHKNEFVIVNEGGVLYTYSPSIQH